MIAPGSPRGVMCHVAEVQGAWRHALPRECSIETASWGLAVCAALRSYAAAWCIIAAEDLGQRRRFFGPFMRAKSPESVNLRMQFVHLFGVKVLIINAITL